MTTVVVVTVGTSSCCRSSDDTVQVAVHSRFLYSVLKEAEEMANRLIPAPAAMAHSPPFCSSAPVLDSVCTALQPLNCDSLFQCSIICSLHLLYSLSSLPFLSSIYVKYIKFKWYSYLIFLKRLHTV